MCQKAVCIIIVKLYVFREAQAEPPPQTHQTLSTTATILYSHNLAVDEKS